MLRIWSYDDRDGPPFHLPVPVHDINPARRWTAWDVDGHQVVTD